MAWSSDDWPEPIALSVEDARNDFPILKRKVGDGKQLIYLDNAATTQKPQQVIDAMSEYYRNNNANVHRAAHTLASEATTAYEESRLKLKHWFGATQSRLVFTSGTTEAINLAAHAWARTNLAEGDVIVLTEMEHHADIVPWQMLAKEKGVELRWTPFDLETFELDMDAFAIAVKGAKLVACVHTSNVLGVRNPIEEIIHLTHEAGAKLILDAAQAAPHDRLNFEGLGVDMLAISAHKMGGPTGIGALIINESTFQQMQPFMGGGDMIREVHLDYSTYQENEHMLEAGTPKIAEAIGWGAAIDWMAQWDIESVHQHGLYLAQKTVAGLRKIPGMRIFGRHAEGDGAVVSFLHESLHANDLASFLDARGFAIRTGHHCAQPLLRKFNIAATNRVSYWLYNTEHEVDEFISAIIEICNKYA